MTFWERTEKNKFVYKLAINSKKFLANFSKKFKKSHRCWNWIGTLSPQGYGRIVFKKCSLVAHRVSYLLAGYKIPKKLVLDHICRNRKCVNPTHLRLTTMKENILCGESPSARKARQIVCIRGHELSGYNIMQTISGFRRCRTCYNAYQRNWRYSRGLQKSERNNRRP